MKIKNRLIALLLTAGLALSLVSGARADVMTLSVSFQGVFEQADGTAAQRALSGSFRVTQGGMDRGTLEAGASSLTVNGTDPVTLIPMAETIEPGWDLSEARVTVPMADGGNVTVPITVRRLAEGSAAARTQSAETPSEEPAPEASPEEKEKDGTEPAEGTEAPSQAAAGKTPAPTATPEWSRATPQPTQTPTPAPQVELLNASADTGAFRVKVFYDSNDNGGCSKYEKGVEGISVYLISRDGEAVTGGETGADGIIELPGLTPGSYKIRVSLPEKWGFNRQSKETGLDYSVMNFSEEGVQDSAEITVAAGETVERGVGLLKGVVVDGVCWLDENGNGWQDGGEYGIPHVKVELVRGGAAVDAPVPAG